MVEPQPEDLNCSLCDTCLTLSSFLLNVFFTPHFHAWLQPAASSVFAVCNCAFVLTVFNDSNLHECKWSNSGKADVRRARLEPRQHDIMNSHSLLQRFTSLTKVNQRRILVITLSHSSVFCALQGSPHSLHSFRSVTFLKRCS